VCCITEADDGHEPKIKVRTYYASIHYMSTDHPNGGNIEEMATEIKLLEDYKNHIVVEHHGRVITLLTNRYDHQIDAKELSIQLILIHEVHGLIPFADYSINFYNRGPSFGKS